MLGGDFDVTEWPRRKASAYIPTPDPGQSQVNVKKGLPSVHLHGQRILRQARKVADIVVCRGLLSMGGGRPETRQGQGEPWP